MSLISSQLLSLRSRAIKDAQIQNQLLKLVKQMLTESNNQAALAALSIDASLEMDLGFDSLDKVELLHRIENTYGVQLTPTDMQQAVTLKDLSVAIIEADPLRRIEARDYIPTLVQSEFDPEQYDTLVEILILRATNEPDRIHVYLQDEQGQEHPLTYGEFYQQAKLIAGSLQGLGIQPGDTIAIMLPTGIDFFLSFFGILLCGAIPVPIYPPYRPDQIEAYVRREAKIMHNAQVRLLITVQQAQELSRLIKSFIPSLRAVKTVDSLKQVKHDYTIVTILPESPAIIQYTSGSTGDPKGVLLTQQNIIANLKSINSILQLKSTDSAMSWLPLYHDMGLVSWLGTFYYGIPLTIISPMTFLTRPERWLWGIHYHRSVFSAGPNFSYELCVNKIDDSMLEGLDLSCWRFAFNGAEAINPKTIERFIRRFSAYGFQAKSLVPVYGLAENTVALTIPRTRQVHKIDHIDRQIFETEQRAVVSDKRNAHDFVYCGQVIPDHEIRIVTARGEVLVERCIGEIEFRGPSAMQGYYDNPIANQKNSRKNQYPWAT